MTRKVINERGMRGVWLGRNEAACLITTLQFGERQASGNSFANSNVREVHRHLESVLRHLLDNGGGMILAEARDHDPH